MAKKENSTGELEGKGRTDNWTEPRLSALFLHKNTLQGRRSWIYSNSQADLN